MMPAFKDFAASAVEDLESAGFAYCSTHLHLAGHWHRDRGDGIEVSQVGLTHVIHRTLTREAYEHGNRNEFTALGLEVRQKPN
jgi:hypothetical protein